MAEAVLLHHGKFKKSAEDSLPRREKKYNRSAIWAKKQMKNIENNTEKSHIAPVFDENDGEILKN